ncbi:MAG: hypothetical protein AAGI52_15750 [Bacteroidota bacterium]
MKHLLVLLSFFVLVGCEAASQDEAPATAVTEWDQQPNYVLGTPPGAGVLQSNDIHHPDFASATRAMFREAGPLIVRGTDVLKADAPALDRHRQLSDVLREADDASAEARWFATTQLSLLALDAFVPARGTADAPPEAVAPYVQNLLDAENPNADLLLRGIRHLNGYWSAEQVQAAARSAADAAVAYLGAPCEDCETDAVSPDRASAISDALLDLNQLAEASE